MTPPARNCGTGTGSGRTWRCHFTLHELGEIFFTWYHGGGNIKELEHSLYNNNDSNTIITLVSGRYRMGLVKL